MAVKSGGPCTLRPPLLKSEGSEPPLDVRGSVPHRICGDPHRISATVPLCKFYIIISISVENVQLMTMMTMALLILVLNDTGNLKKLVILKADQNQLLHLPVTIAQYVL